MKNKYLFLDFDGVLHPSSTSFDDKKSHFLHAPALAGLLMEFPCLIVISSSWRFSYTLEELKKLLPKAISNCVVDKTGDPYLGNYPRYNEIKTYLDTKNKSLEDWKALDDSKHEFPGDCPNLIHCDIPLGMNNKNIKELKKWLQK